MPITTEVIVERTQLPELIARLPELANQAVREQGQVCVADAKTNIVKYNAIDTGTMLGSVATHARRVRGRGQRQRHQRGWLPVPAGGQLWIEPGRASSVLHGDDRQSNS